MKRPDLSKSPFDKQELEYFKNLLLEKRREAAEQIKMTTDNISILDDENDPDYRPASDIEEASADVQRDSVNYQLLERTRKYIKQIDDALSRIENNTYGICQATGIPISKGRLEAVPHTRYSIEAKNNELD